jgi:hypothetical protein
MRERSAKALRFALERPEDEGQDEQGTGQRQSACSSKPVGGSS